LATLTSAGVPDDAVGFFPLKGNKNGSQLKYSDYVTLRCISPYFLAGFRRFFEAAPLTPTLIGFVD